MLLVLSISMAQSMYRAGKSSPLSGSEAIHTELDTLSSRGGLKQGHVMEGCRLGCGTVRRARKRGCIAALSTHSCRDLPTHADNALGARGIKRVRV